MPRSAFRWVVGAAAGIVVSSGLANGAAQAAGPLDGVAGLTGATGLTGMLTSAVPVNGILPAIK